MATTSSNYVANCSSCKVTLLVAIAIMWLLDGQGRTRKDVM